MIEVFSCAFFVKFCRTWLIGVVQLERMMTV